MLFNKALGIVVEGDKHIGVLYLSKKCEVEIMLLTNNDLSKHFYNVFVINNNGDKELRLYGVRDEDVPFVRKDLIGLNNKVILLFVRIIDNIKYFAVLLPNGKSHYFTEVDLLKILSYKPEFVLSNAIVQNGSIKLKQGYEFRIINNDKEADFDSYKYNSPIYNKFFKWYMNDVFISTYYELEKRLAGYAVMPSLSLYQGVELNNKLTRVIARCIKQNVRREVYYINGRKHWGKILTKPEDIEYKFEVSNNFVNYTSDLQRDVAAHEWIHAICPPGVGHGPQYKVYMFRLNHTGLFNISVYEDDDRLTDEMLAKRAESARYIMRCKNCGNEIYQSRLSRFIEHPECYRCSKCKGSFERIK